MGLRAVVFDLFDTLIDGRPGSHDRVAHLPTEVVAAFDEVWNDPPSADKPSRDRRALR